MPLEYLLLCSCMGYIVALCKGCEEASERLAPGESTSLSYRQQSWLVEQWTANFVIAIRFLVVITAVRLDRALQPVEPVSLAFPNLQTPL